MRNDEPRFRPDPDCPFDGHPDPSQRKRDWLLDDGAAELVFGLGEERPASAEERAVLARRLRERDK